MNMVVLFGTSNKSKLILTFWRICTAQIFKKKGLEPLMIKYNLFNASNNYSTKPTITSVKISSMNSKQVTKSLTKSGEALEKLKGLGYAFNNAGQLCKINKTTGELSDEPFEFDVYKNLVKNQAHYERLADQIPEIVYELLEQNGMTRIYIPEDVSVEESTFFFVYPEKLNKPKKLIVIIHGSGFVRAGQWARSLIINKSLDHGTQLPYINRARDLGYDIVVTNTNDNYRIVDGVRKPILGLNSAGKHAAHVWEKYVIACHPEAVAIVAHSAGGAVTLDLVKRYPKFFQSHVFAIAFTDSAHNDISDEVRKVICNKTCNWISSTEPLDTEINSSSYEFKTVSAGHPKHEWTSYSAFDSVFKFLEGKYKNFV